MLVQRLYTLVEADSDTSYSWAHQIVAHRGPFVGTAALDTSWLGSCSLDVQPVGKDPPAGSMNDRLVEELGTFPGLAAGEASVPGSLHLDYYDLLIFRDYFCFYW